MSGPTLAERVAEAIGATLDGEVTLAYDAIIARLPTYLIEAKPKKKTIVDAIRAAGWSSYKNAEGTVIWRAALSDSDPLRHRGEGDNSAAEQLRLYIERCERLIEERTSLNEDLADVFAEAKAVGFDVKTMRVVIKLRATDKHLRDEADALLETYRTALGMG